MNIRPIIENAQRLCLFGAGSLLRECYGQLVFFLGREPDFVCDNDPSKWGTAVHGKTCISPEELLRQRKGTAVIITVRHYQPIARQLRGLGVHDFLVCCFDSGYYQVRGIRPDEEPAASSIPGPLMVDLKGKWTLVTGASRGVGRQIALTMARLGSNIIAHSRCVSHLQELAEACATCGVQIVPAAAELTNAADLEEMLTRLGSIAPRVDIVFNNAAIAPYCAEGFWGISASIYHDCYTVNAIAPMRICQHLVPPMIRRGFGRVVNISTNIRNQPGEMAYATSKAALDKFVYDLSPALHGTGVMMSLADPGWVRTDAGGPDAPNAVESVIPGIVLGAVLEGDVNGCRFSAQEYAGLSIEAACRQARHHQQKAAGRWI